MTLSCRYDAVLFDLDGTLCDTALDLTLALNRLLEQEHSPPLTLAAVRTQVSHGGRAMIRLAFPHANESQQIRLRDRLLALYAEQLTWHTRLFPGLDRVLQALAEQNIPWGIVTNKPAHLTEPLVRGLNLPYPPLSVISGDTLPVAKPDPTPLLLAAEHCGVSPDRCVYIGDHPRDVEAARAAGMDALAVSFGYLEPQDNPHDWGALAVADTPWALARWLGVEA